MQAILALEDGRIFRGESYGAKRECFGEVVFNTALTSYQEIFTDPSYAGQIVVLTNPQIGNYGTNAADNEATRPYIEGLVTREFSPVSSNWRSQQVTEEYLERFNVPVIAEIDTRAVVRHLRTYGALRGVISSMESDVDKLILKARGIRKMDGTDLAKVVSTKAAYEWDWNDRRNFNGDPLQLGDESLKLPAPDLHVVAYDFGIKHNILRMLAREACRVTVVPAETSAEDVLALEPRRHFSVEWAGRSRAGNICPGKYPQARRPEADVWYLPGSPVDRPGTRWQNLQAEVWTSRRQPPGAADANRQSGDNRAQPQFCRRSDPSTRARSS